MSSPLVKGGLTTRAKLLLGIAVVVLTTASVHRLYWADLPGPVFEFSGPTMGTTFLVKVAAEELSQQDHATLARAIRERLAAVNRSMSTWDPHSEISSFNRHASTEPFPASRELRKVISASFDVSEASGGAFHSPAQVVQLESGVDVRGQDRRGVPHEPLLFLAVSHRVTSCGRLLVR